MSRWRLLLILIVFVEAADIAWIRYVQGPRIPVPEVDLEKLPKESKEIVSEIMGAFEPGSAYSWIGLAEVLRSHGYLPEANYCFQQAASYGELDGDSLYYWGTCLSQMGELEQARRKFAQAIIAKTKHELFCNAAIGMTHLRDGSTASAEDAFARAEGLPHPRLFYARMLMRKGRLQEAKALVDGALNVAPDSIRYRQMKSWVEQALGNDEIANQYAALAQRGTKRVQDSEDPAMFEMQRIDEMVRDPFFNKSRELASAGKIDEAISVMEPLRQSDYWDEYASYIAALEIDRGRPNEAIAIVESAIKNEGVSGPLLLSLGRAYEALGKVEEARLSYERGKQLDPFVIELYQSLETIYTKQGNQRLAEENRGMVEFWLGKNAWLKDDLRSALPHFQLATDLASDYAHAWYYLADTHRNLGDLEASRNAYQRCLEVNPDHGRALRWLEYLRRRK